MVGNVSCVRAAKWAAWHLQLQPLGLNKGRSLAAFPTQLSPFSRGFHSCFVRPVPVYWVHTMRRHLGRVHSFVFSIFPPRFWLPFFYSPPQTSPGPTVANCTRFFYESKDRRGVSWTRPPLQIRIRLLICPIYSSGFHPSLIGPRFLVARPLDREGLLEWRGP